MKKLITKNDYLSEARAFLMLMQGKTGNIIYAVQHIEDATEAIYMEDIYYHLTHALDNVKAARDDFGSGANRNYLNRAEKLIEKAIHI